MLCCARPREKGGQVARKLRTSRKFNQFLKYTLGIFLTKRYGLRSENVRIFESVKPPYVLLPNHVCFWDPFFIANFVPDPVYYVISDLWLRMPIFRFLLSLVGAIPKSKAISDFETVRNIFSVKKKNGVIGIFPEGRRNWDGHTMPTLFATTKLIKALKLPVLIPILKGAFLALPRWSRSYRKGPVTVEFKFGFTVEELKEMSHEEIYEKLTKLVEYDEWDYQRDHMIPYKSRRRAERIELALFVCQSCRSIGSLRSSGARLLCEQCGHSVIYTEYGFFEEQHGKNRFSTIREWNLWQLDHLEELFTRHRKSDEDDPVFADGPAWVWMGYKRNPMKKLRTGTLALYVDRVEFTTLLKEKIVFPMDRIKGTNVQNKEKMEFYCDDHLYSFHFRDPSVSGYKWLVSLNILRGIEAMNVDSTVERAD